MVKIEVLKTYKDKSGMNWVILESLVNGRYMHLFARGDLDLKVGDEWDVPLDISDFIDWVEFQNVELNPNLEANSLNTKLRKGYGVNSKINFGLYKGYQLGLVYAFDPEYLEWCIDNIESFYINDLEQLQAFGVLKVIKGHSTHREAGIPSFCGLIDEFETVQELIIHFRMANIEYRFRNEIITLNEEKMRRSS